jgi:hypothetical protein
VVVPILMNILVMINPVDVKMMKLNLVILSMLLLSSCVGPRNDHISDEQRTRSLVGIIGRLSGTVSEHEYHTRYSHGGGCTNSCCN